MAAKLSILVPCHNEEDNVRPLCEGLATALSDVIDFEIVFIDDGSTDGTLETVVALCDEQPNVRFIALSRNFGHQNALMAGLDHVDADAVVMMDADLQHPPELVPVLVEKWREGYEVVYTLRKDPDHGDTVKRVTSRLFYRLMNFLSDVRLPEGVADFRLIDRKVLDVFREEVREYFLFLRGLTAWVGFRQCAVPYTPAARHAGRTKYSFRRMISFALDGITSFSTKPIRLSIGLGVTISGLTLVYAIYAFCAWAFARHTVPGWTSVILSVLFIGGIQMVLLGIIGEYVGKMFHEVKRRPRYIIRETNLLPPP